MFLSRIVPILLILFSSNKSEQKLNSLVLYKELIIAIMNGNFEKARNYGSSTILIYKIFIHIGVPESDLAPRRGGRDSIRRLFLLLLKRRKQ